MDTTTVDKRIAALRADDSLIEGHLAELDTKLATWMAAMREGLAAMREGLKRVASASEAGPGPAPAALPQRVERLGFAAETGMAPEQAAVVGSDQARSRAAATPEDDETLLKSLDEDTANAIRVKRRLIGEKRTVRELLEEIRSARPAVREAGPNRKRRWRRRND